MTVIHLLARGVPDELVRLTLADLITQSAAAWPIVLHADSLPSVDGPAGRVVLATAGTMPDVVSGAIVLVRAGVRLPYGWDVRLAAARAADPACATFSPLCDAVGAHASGMDAADGALALRDQRAFATGSGRVRTTPAASPVLSLIAPEWAAGLMLSGEPAQLSAIGWDIQAQGGCLGLVDAVLVDWVGPPLAADGPAEMASVLTAHLTSNPVPKRAYPDKVEPSYLLDGRPVQLHIMHSWGGGIERWVHDYCTAEPDRVHLVLKASGVRGLYGQWLALYQWPQSETPLRVWELASPIRATAVHHSDYQQILREIVEQYLVDAVMVSSLIGHSLDALRTGLPTVHVWHEYYPFCPALGIHYEGICRQCDVSRLGQCLKNNPLNEAFHNVTAEEWMAIRRGYVDAMTGFSVRPVAPSQSVIDHYRELQPELMACEPVVIPHGIDWPPVARPARETRGKLKVVVLGVLAEHKGRRVFDALWQQVAGTVEFILLGCGESGRHYEGRAGITVMPRYTRAELPALLARLSPDAGLLLSIWPETFSYTLSELMCAGIPPIAPIHGAYPERIRDGENGFLCKPDAAELVPLLQRLHANRALLAQASEVLIAAPHRSHREMVADYRTLLPLRALSGGCVMVPRAAHGMAGVPHATMAHLPKPFLQVLYESHAYLRQKILHSTALRGWQRRILHVVLEGTMRVIYRVWRWVSKGGPA